MGPHRELFLPREARPQGTLSCSAGSLSILHGSFTSGWLTRALRTSRCSDLLVTMAGERLRCTLATCQGHGYILREACRSAAWVTLRYTRGSVCRVRAELLGEAPAFLGRELITLKNFRSLEERKGQENPCRLSITPIRFHKELTEASQRCFHSPITGGMWPDAGRGSLQL